MLLSYFDRMGPLRIKTAYSEDPQEFNAKRFFIHPEFKPGQLDNDIALLMLDKDVK